jgi:hypothetical protein
MAEWVELTEAVALNAMPTDLAALYTSWVQSNPDKAARLAELTAESVAIWRDAVAANPANELDEDTTKVPMAGFRHALNTIIFNLGMEMGVQFAGEVYSLVARAEMWLRGVQSGSIPVGNAGASASPSYEPPDPAERTVEA